MCLCTQNMGATGGRSPEISEGYGRSAALRFDTHASRTRWIEKGVKRRDPPLVHDDNTKSSDPARFVRRAERPGKPTAILHGINAADLRKDMVRELRLEGDNYIFHSAMPDVPAAWIGEEAVAIEYRLDRGRAPYRVARSPKTS
jgi:hypothetical protein